MCPCEPLQAAAARFASSHETNGNVETDYPVYDSEETERLEAMTGGGGKKNAARKGREGEGN
jgi:hypothetical protein